jgi:hypothetical protein
VPAPTVPAEVAEVTEVIEVTEVTEVIEPEPEPAEPVAAEAQEVGAEAGAAGAPGSWSDPDDDGSCPASYPIKAKLASKVFHLPGMANYERTKADRCYLDASAAEADGLRQAKR